MVAGTATLASLGVQTTAAVGVSGKLSDPPEVLENSYDHLF